SAVESAAASMRMHAPKIPLISNVTAEAMSGAPDAAYWREHLLRPVRFMDSVRALRARGITAFLEIGPSPVLCALGRQIDDDGAWVASLRKETTAERPLALALATLFTPGLAIDWTRHRPPRHHVDLPASPFDRARYTAYAPPPDNSLPPPPPS